MHKEYDISSFVREKVRIAVKETLDEWIGHQMEEESQIVERLITRIIDNINRKRNNGIIFHGISVKARGPRSLESILGADIAGIITIRVPGFQISKLFLAQVKLIKESDRFFTKKPSDPKRKDSDFIELLMNYDISISKDYIDRMERQCFNMLRFTKDSIIMFILPDEIRVIDATSIHIALESWLREYEDLYKESRFLPHILHRSKEEEEAAEHLNKRKKLFKKWNIESQFYSKSLQSYFQEICETWQGDTEKGVEVISHKDIERIVKEYSIHQGFAIIADDEEMLRDKDDCESPEQGYVDDVLPQEESP